jgi:voltage-gated potassium channel
VDGFSVRRFGSALAAVATLVVTASVFTGFLVLAGVALFAYVAGSIVELIARGVVGDAYGHRRRRRAIDKLRDHTIICGYGRVGRPVASELFAPEELLAC